ncbi:helix-turn-helix domain-containing protein [Parabacteroides sp. OttesenSCG-928-G07]|nr:helix-turn-helix domain-containing protein [Parabacteroides sp. OttesenSCG-928-G21]MDL2277949.1 helix-turn-helix domain-containing protein [Parabacteroides sp. OttesenSCG-928-G07]
MTNLAIYNQIPQKGDLVNYEIEEIVNFNIDNTNFLVFSRWLYMYLQNSTCRTEITELMEQASVYMDNSILLKYELMYNCRKGRQNEIFEKFLSIISLHCSAKHSVRFYADKLFISPQYLSKISKDVSGRSANAWIDEFILLEARTLLMRTNLTIQEISLKIGFSDQSSFGKFFKKYVGLSPTLYVKNMKISSTSTEA